MAKRPKPDDIAATLLPVPAPAPDETPAPRTGAGSRPVISPLNGAMIMSGGHPHNTGNKPGQVQTPSKDFKRICRNIINDPRVPQTLEEMLFARDKVKDPVTGEMRDVPAVSAKAFIEILDTLAGYVVEKPKTTTKLMGGLTLEALVAGSTRDGRVDDTEDDESDDHDDHEE